MPSVTSLERQIVGGLEWYPLFS